MRFSLVAVLALASSALAAKPADEEIQKELQSLQITMVNLSAYIARRAIRRNGDRDAKQMCVFRTFGG